MVTTDACRDDADTRIEELIERSSLGAPGARRLRERIPPDEARSILALARASQLLAAKVLLSQEESQEEPESDA